jgi:hypothetical protein
MSYPEQRLRYNRQNTENVRGIKTMNINMPDVYKQNLIETEAMKYQTKVHYVNITSAARSSSQLLHYDYYINLPQTYKNVVMVEMKSCTLPNSTDINLEPYLVFDIDELNCIDFVNNDHNTSGFAVLPIKTTSADNSFLVPELGCIYNVKYEPDPAKTLTRLTIKIRDMNGNLYNFGYPSGSTVKAVQHSFVLKITTEEANKSSVIREHHTY